jgi:ABC-type Co2+ transport system permease subunit
MPTQLPLGVLEAIVSGAAVKFLIARRPEFLEQARAGAAG